VAGGLGSAARTREFAKLEKAAAPPMARPDALMKSRREAGPGIPLLVRSVPAGDPAELRFLSVARLLPSGEWDQKRAQS
jgi:hypothetical protein